MADRVLIQENTTQRREDAENAELLFVLFFYTTLTISKKYYIMAYAVNFMPGM